MTVALPDSPFGHSITPDELVDTLSFFDDWEERYKYIIDLGKQLPPLPEALKTEAALVRGCQSQVWLHHENAQGHIKLAADSDALIVKGLLGVVLSAYNGKTPEAILAYDIEGLFADIELLQHLSPTRGNGLKSMVQRIKDIAAAQ